MPFSRSADRSVFVRTGVFALLAMAKYYWH